MMNTRAQSTDRIHLQAKFVFFALFAALLISCAALPQVALADDRYKPPTEIDCTEHSDVGAAGQAQAVLQRDKITYPSCTEDGQVVYWCSVSPNPTTSGHEIIVKVPALGHVWEDYDRKDADCTHAGYNDQICSYCKARQKTDIAALGHNYGDWVVDSAATEQAEGSEHRVCSRCGDRQDRSIAKLAVSSSASNAEPVEQVTEQTTDGNGEDMGPVTAILTASPDDELEVMSIGAQDNSADKPFPTGAAAAAAAAVAAAGAAYAFILRPRRIAQAAKLASEAASNAANAAGTASTAAEAAEFSFEPVRDPKSILACVDSQSFDALLKLLRKQVFLSVRNLEASELASLPETAAELEPDLIVLALNSPEQLPEVQAAMEACAASYEDAVFCLIADELADGSPSPERAAAFKALLDPLVEEKSIQCYVLRSEHDLRKLVKFVLPLYKTVVSSDNGLIAMGSVADALGIPFVSTLTECFRSGREIKDIMAQGETSPGDKSLIIADIAGVMGLDGLSSVADFISCAESAKDIITDDEMHVSEHADLIEAVKDMAGDILG